MKKKTILKYQNMVLKALAGKIPDFYLVGGTALSVFYFQHRLSIDLDFFTSDFSIKRINEITAYLQDNLKKEVKLIGQVLTKNRAKIQIYDICFSKKDTLKIDFVEDFFKLLKPPKVVNGINISSLEDIYLRKLYAVVGVIPIHDAVGRKLAGGRFEARDFYDIYFLSNTFMPLSKFVDKYADDTTKEGLISWFRIYDRMQMIDSILSLDVDKEVDYKSMEKHLKKQIDKIIESYIEKI